MIAVMVLGVITCKREGWRSSIWADEEELVGGWVDMAGGATNVLCLYEDSCC